MIEVLQSASAILFNERLGIKIVCNSISISFIEERWYCHLKCTGLEITLFEKNIITHFIIMNLFIYIILKLYKTFLPSSLLRRGTEARRQAQRRSRVSGITDTQIIIHAVASCGCHSDIFAMVTVVIVIAFCR